MLVYLIHRLSYGLIILFGVISIVFVLFNVLPGDPARMMLDQREDQQQLLNIKKKYGFDKPLFDQYVLYLNDLSVISVHSKNTDDYTHLESKKYKFISLVSSEKYNIVAKLPHLRTSFKQSGKSVSHIIADTLPNTIVLALASISIAILLGIVLGILSAIYKDSWIDKSALFFGVLGMSIPSFFSAIIFAWLFGFVWHDITGLNMTGSLYSVDDYGRGEYLSLSNLILPAITLGIRPLAVIMQLSRSSFLETLSKDYVRTAKAKGLSYFKVITKHVLKNSLNPVVTAISGWFASLLAGAVFVEYIFAWNGLGKEIVDALNQLDLPVVMGSVLTISTLFICIHFLVDIIYAYLDPRIKIN
ncbi:MAG: ABC transporter permease [Flavobacteriales bacterium]